MNKNPLRFGFIAATASIAIDGVSGLVLLKLLSSYLLPEAAGFWIFVTATGSFLLLLQCGLGPTIARNVARASGNEDIKLLQTTSQTTKLAMRCTMALVAICGVVFYFLQIKSAGRQANLGWVPKIIWTLYVFSIAVTLYGQGALFILNGLGKVGWDRLIRAATSILSIFGIWFLLSRGYGILEISVLNLGISIAFAWAAYKRLYLEYPELNMRGDSDKKLLREMFLSSSKLMILNLMGFAVTNLGMFEVEHRFGLNAVPPYAAMSKVGALLATMAGIIPNLTFPYIAKYHALGDRKSCHRYYYIGIFVSLVMVVGMAQPIYWFRYRIFQMWLGDTNFLQPPTFLYILIFNALLTHHIAQSMPALAIAGHTFIFPAIINGFLVIALLSILPKYLGIQGIPLAMILGTIGPSVYVSWTSYKLLNFSGTQK